MSEVDFNRYKNILIFAKEWRKFTINSPILDYDTFRKTILSDHFIKIECFDEIKNKDILIYLFDKHSKYISNSQDFKKILKKIEDLTVVILVTYLPLNVYHKKAVNAEKKLTIYDYRHENFDLVLPNGPLCYPHRILSREEVLELTNNDLFCYITNLPRILDSDPQCIWIGAQATDIIEVKNIGDIMGEAYRYHVVVPKNGKFTISKVNNVEKDLDEEQNKEILDDDVLEHLENNKNISDGEDDEEDDVDKESITSEIEE